jgi:hypothetical protein
MKPCACCPFRADAPLGIWEASHYLAIAYLGSADIGELAVRVMGCHRFNGVMHPKLLPEKSPVCGGWARAARNTPAIRLAAMMGRVSISDLEDTEGILSPEAMAERNGLDLERLPPLTWRPGLRAWPNWSDWVSHTIELRSAVLDNPQIALDYVLPGSPLDLGVSRDTVRKHLGENMVRSMGERAEEG